MEMSERLSEFDPKPIASLPVRQRPLAALPGGAVDWNARQTCQAGQRSFDASGRNSGPRRSRHRFRGDHAGRWLEIDADAAPIC